MPREAVEFDRSVLLLVFSDAQRQILDFVPPGISEIEGADGSGAGLRQEGRVSQPQKAGFTVASRLV